MRTLLLAFASLLLAGGSAMAQNSDSPLSNTATHTSSVNTRSSIAPRLPGSGENLSVNEYLNHARTALTHGGTGMAQEALERAETRLLSRSTLASQATAPSSDPKLVAVESARQALGKNDRNGAMQSIQIALTTPSSSSQADAGMNGGMTGSTMRASTPASSYVYKPTSPNVPPNSLGGIGSSVGGDDGTGTGSQLRPQASFSGPTSSSNVVPSPADNALGGALTSTSGLEAGTPAQ